MSITFKKITILVFLTTWIFQWSQAQDRAAIADRMESQRVAFITQKLDLSPSEAQAFWPIYNDYKAKERALREQRKPMKGIRDLDETEAKTYIDKILDLEQQELELKREYTAQWQSVLSARKVLRLYVAERMFKERLLQAMQKRRGQPQHKK